MTTMEVWRIEYPDDELGPYGTCTDRPEPCDALGENLADAHCDGNQHPGPHWDGLVASGRHFGCPTLISLRAWFAGWWGKLQDAGFVITKYVIDAHHVRIGKSKRQVAFCKDLAIKREVMPW